MGRGDQPGANAREADSVNRARRVITQTPDHERMRVARPPMHPYRCCNEGDFYRPASSSVAKLISIHEHGRRYVLLRCMSPVVAPANGPPPSSSAWGYSGHGPKARMSADPKQTSASISCYSGLISASTKYSFECYHTPPEPGAAVMQFARCSSHSCFLAALPIVSVANPACCL